MKNSHHLRMVASLFPAAVLTLSLNCSHRSSDDPVTITFLDPQWAHDPSGLGNLGRDERLEGFTGLTGIRVKHLPVPEGALDQLEEVREQLRKPSPPDVSSIDVFWPGILSEDLSDLKTNLSPELASMNPEVVASYTVNGKVVAAPYSVDMGVLFYRKDLLRKYAYGKPPETWDELEKMAARIQRGERTQQDFWGYVWPGAAGEGLTCNALEWQAAEGGGRIIEADKTISVNNPHLIRAWQRAAHWVGWISPASVTSYEEWDAINMFFSGRAAFMRGWALSYSAGFGGKPINKDRFGITHVPGGRGGQAATLGGFGLAVSRSAPHPAEGLRLVQLLVQGEKRYTEAGGLQGSANFDIPNPWKNRLNGRVVTRPSAVAGKNYEAVDHAYLEALHSVLTGEAKAPDAAAALERDLVRITGFNTGPPTRVYSAMDASGKALP